MRIVLNTCLHIKPILKERYDVMTSAFAGVGEYIKYAVYKNMYKQQEFLEMLTIRKILIIKFRDLELWKIPI